MGLLRRHQLSFVVIAFEGTELLAVSKLLGHCLKKWDFLEGCKQHVLTTVWNRQVSSGKSVEAVLKGWQLCERGDAAGRVPSGWPHMLLHTFSREIQSARFSIVCLPIQDARRLDNSHSPRCHV